MARTRRALWLRVGLPLSAAAWAFAPAPAGAVPSNCPADFGPSTCVVEVGDNFLEVDAADQDLIVYEWDVAGISQVYEERFPILDVLAFPQQAFDLRLDSATADGATATIVIGFVEAQGVFHESAIFTLSATPNGAALDESVVLDTFSVTRVTRLYVVTDFDLDGDTSDDSMVASTGGTLMVQTDGQVTAVLEADPAPDAFQVATCCTLSDLALGTTFFQLDGTTTLPGPADFSAAVSWNRTLGTGNSFTATLRREITVPEPTVPSGAVAGALALLALRASRGSRRAGAITSNG